MSFIQVVRGRPGGRLQFSGGGSKTAWLGRDETLVELIRADSQQKRNPRQEQEQRRGVSKIRFRYATRIRISSELMRVPALAVSRRYSVGNCRDYKNLLPSSVAMVMF